METESEPPMSRGQRSEGDPQAQGAEGGLLAGPVLLAEVLPHELVAGEGAGPLGTDVDVGEVSSGGEDGDAGGEDAHGDGYLLRRQR